MTDLDDLLLQAREADPGERILLRDRIAAHGEDAIEAMTDWLGDPRLAAFAVRVLERIGGDLLARPSVIEVLQAIDREEWPGHLAGDVSRTLAALGASPVASRARRPSSGTVQPRPPGEPGRPGIDYWVMRTSPWERPFIWAEAQRGRLRQGWGWDESQNLEVIAEAQRLGRPLTDLQRLAWRARRMRTSADGGMRVGDVIVAPNLPEWGRLSVFGLVGSYTWAPEELPGRLDRFGHVLPVELLVANIDRRAPVVSDALRAMLRPQTRLYRITEYGGDVERVVAFGRP